MHLLWFIFVILVASGIMYGLRGDTGMAYIDCLFLSASGMTVTGLVTYPASQLTLGQQILVFILMSMGNLVVNSMVIVLLRRHFFGKKFRKVVKRSASVRARMRDIEHQERQHHEEEVERVRRFFGLRHIGHDVRDTHDEKRRHKPHGAEKPKGAGANKRPKLHAGMVQRMDEPARQVNPTGQMTTMVANREPDEPHAPGTPSEPHAPSEPSEPTLLGSNEPTATSILQSGDAPSDAPGDAPTSIRIAEPDKPEPSARVSEDRGLGVRIADADKSPGVRIAEPEKPPVVTAEPERIEPAAERTPATPAAERHAFLDPGPRDIPMRRRSLEQERPKDANPVRRVHTVSFAEQAPEVKHDPELLRPRRAVTMGGTEPFAARTPSLARTNTMQTGSEAASHPRAALHRTMTRNMNRGLGGFPSPMDWAMGILESLNMKQRLRVPRSSTMASAYPERSSTIESGGPTRLAPYLTFDATVTGNSHFHNLTHAQRNELGGVEYRALDVLAWLIPAYWLGWFLLAIVITTPYMASRSAAQYRAVIDDQPKPPHNPEWFWVFNTMSAITNTGMSLADVSFQEGLRNGYMMLIPVTVLVLVGNTAYPVMLRFLIWLLSKCVWRESRLYESLRFLLDHPRRCFVYLFPRENTWFLFGLILFLTIVDWFFLMILDLQRRKEAQSVGAWVFDALFQSVAIRSAGFQTFNVLDLAPAEQMLQVFMMYLAVFPLTMAVRTTNVYEEGSLGVYDEEPPPDPDTADDGRAVWGRFLSEQVRRQLAFDLWWIALAVWIVLIAEQGKIEDREKYPNLTIFTILYELVSAYGTVGISCGAQYHNSSLVGDFTVISKLIVIAVMVRGRHRGLPSAIDRAIMLPSELHAYDQTHDMHYTTPRTLSTEPGPPPDASDDEPHAADAPSARASGVQPSMSSTGLQRVSTMPAHVHTDLAPIAEAATPESPPKPPSVHSL